MPNWCSNGLTLSHDDPAMITKAAEALKAGTFLDTFIPIPAELKETTSPAKEGSPSVEFNGTQYSDWYSFCVNEWGTKWDVESYSEPEVSESGLSLEASFDSAWSPPIEAYRKLDEMGFTVKAVYYEPGMGFCGDYSTDGDEQFYDYSGLSADEAEAEIPEYINEYFNITEYMRDWEEENQEIDLDGGLSAINE